jgi:hypothetical protein
LRFYHSSPVEETRIKFNHRNHSSSSATRVAAERELLGSTLGTLKQGR